MPQPHSCSRPTPADRDEDKDGGTEKETQRQSETETQNRNTTLKCEDEGPRTQEPVVFSSTLLRQGLSCCLAYTSFLSLKHLSTPPVPSIATSARASEITDACHCFCLFKCTFLELFWLVLQAPLPARKIPQACS